MAKKKNSESEEIVEKKKVGKDSDEDSPSEEGGIIDPSIIEDGFTDDFSEYNDVDNF
jgi:hypothetical protein